MPLNPDRNLFSVGPVGSAIIIARHAALKGGLARERVVNLIGWLCIAGNVKPEEVAAEIRLASQPIRPPVSNVPTTTVQDPAAKPPAAVVRAPTPQRPAVPTATQTPPVAPVTPDSVPPAVAREVIPFIGNIDPEEAAALREGIERTAAIMEAGGGTPEVNVDELANAWGNPQQRRGG